MKKKNKVCKNCKYAELDGTLLLCVSPKASDIRWKTGVDMDWVFPDERACEFFKTRK